MKQNLQNVRRFGRTLGILGLILGYSLVLTTCKSPLIGLGGQVDMEAPRSLSVSPGQGSYRSGTIAVSGSAKDNYGLASVQVSVIDRSSGQTLLSLPASVSGNTWTTGTVLDTSLFPDGLYTILVVLKDARGNQAEDRVLVGFDNRPPTVLIEEPLDLTQAYNGNILISGQAYDALAAVQSVEVQVWRAGDSAPLYSGLSATTAKWLVVFNANDTAYGLDQDNPEHLWLRVIATDEAGNGSSYHYEYRAVYEANDNQQYTAAQLDLLENSPTPSLPGPGGSGPTPLAGLRRGSPESGSSQETILIVDSDSDKPVFEFVTPGEGSSSVDNAERFAGGSRANGVVRDDDLNNQLIVQYRIALTSASLEAAGWQDADVQGSGYEARWSFTLPGTNGLYHLQLRGEDDGGAEGLSAIKYVIIDDGRPLVTINTEEPDSWKLYYGRDQEILVTGTAERSGIGNYIDQVEIRVGNRPWLSIDAPHASGLGTSLVSWTAYPLSLSGLAGGSTQVRIRARDQDGVWGQSEVLIIMDVDAPHITIDDPGSNLNGMVTFRGSVGDGSGDAFITVMDRVEAKINDGDYEKITGTYAWSYPFDTRSLGDGTHSLWIRAWDAAGNSSELERPFSVLQSTDKPSLSVTNLTANQVVGGAYIVSGTTGDDDGLSSDADAIQVLVEREISPGSWENEGWANVSSRSGPATALAWTYSLPDLSSGTYRFSVRARDNNSQPEHYGSTELPERNYWHSLAPVIFLVDNDVPVVQTDSLSPASASLVNAGFSLSGSISEDKNLAKVEVFVNNLLRGNASFSGNPSTGYNFTFSVLAEWLTLGANSIRIEATDASSPAKTGSATLQIIYDTELPSASFLTPANSSLVNGSITISGLASDNNQVSALYRAVRPLADGLPSFPADYQLIPEARYSFNVSLDTTSLIDETAYRVYLVAVDAAGNTNALEPAHLDLLVSQASDRPVIKLSNLRTDGQTVLKMVNTIFGSVSDDDGSVLNLSISQTGLAGSWQSLSLSGGSFSYDSQGGDGDKTVFFQVTDATGRVFSTTAAVSLDRPRIESNPATEPVSYVDGPISFKVDTAPPEINAGSLEVDRRAPFTFDDPLALSTNLAFGGSSAQFRVRAQASDDNGIAEVYATVPGASPAVYPMLLVDDYYTSGTIDVSGLADGPLVLSITAVDNSGLQSSLTRTIIIDNTGPSLSFVSPRSMVDVVNGNIEVKGQASDGGSGLKSLHYQVGYHFDPDPDSSLWQSVGGSLFSWQIDFKDSQRIDLYAGLPVSLDPGTGRFHTDGTHGYALNQALRFSGLGLPVGLSRDADFYARDLEASSFRLSASPGGPALSFATAGLDLSVSAYGRDENGDEVWTVPIILKAEDLAGNISITTAEDYILLVDPSGDKPRVTIVYPDPDNSNRTLGGNIRIFGSAIDDDAVDSVWMQIDVNGDGLFNASDVASDGTDWYNGGLGRKVNGTVSWNWTINTNQEFDPPGEGTRTIFFRVRARDIYGLDGPWTEAQRIDVDKNVPKIGSAEPLSLVQGDTRLPYVADTWLKGQWFLTGSVEDESGIANITFSGDINGSLSGNPDWFQSIGGGNYRFTIPLTTAASAGRLSFTITALDASTPQLQAVVPVSVQADNQAPSLNAYTGSLPIEQSNLSYTLASSFNETGSGFGRVAFYLVRRDRGGDSAKDRVYLPMANNSFSNLSALSLIDGLYYLEGNAQSRPSPYSLVDANLIGNPFVRVGGLIRIAGLDRRIIGVDQASGTVTWADEIDQTITAYHAAYAMVVDNLVVETPVYSGNSLVNILNDDGDGMVESVERSGGLYSWTASIDSRNIPDGPIEIHWVSYDQAGNYATASLSTSIANNQPLLASVSLGTDLDGNGEVDGYELVPPFSALDGNGQAQANASVGSSAFLARGKTSLDISILGGNGQLFYRLLVDGQDIHGGLRSLRADEEAPVQSIILSEAELLSALIGEGEKTLYIEIWDSTEETEAGSDSLRASLQVPLTVNLVDGIAPKVVISPLYWNSATDNSLYLNSKAQGHIELPEDLPVDIFNQANGLYDLDAKVSGSISIRGTAYDDQRLSAIWIFIGNTTNDLGRFVFANALDSKNSFDTDADGTTENLLRTYSLAARFNTTTGQWEAANASISTHGWQFSIQTLYLDQSGHKVAWQLDWDSSRITNSADTDRTFRIIAEDRRLAPQPNASSESQNAAPGIDAQHNVPAYRFDVVPYISSLTTPKRTSGGLKNNNIRSSTGAYSIITGNDGEFIQVHGFNLNPNSVRIIPSALGPTNSVTTASGIPLAYSNVAANRQNFTLSNNSSRSGYLEVFTNGVRSLNNVNENDASGSFSGDTPEHTYNREPDRYVTKNLRLTDDRYLRFFNMRTTNIKNGYYPDMIMEGNDVVFGYVNLTGGPGTAVGLNPGTGAGSYQPSHAMPQRAKFNGSTAAEMTTEYLIKASIWDQMAMAKDDANRYYHATIYNRDNAAMSLIYDRYAELFTNGMGWGTGTGYQNYTGDWSENANNNAITLERTNFGDGLLLGRYQYPKLIARGNSIIDHAKVYMLYYDDNTVNRELIFRNLRIGTNVTGGGTAALHTGGVSSTGQAYAQRANLADENTSGRITAASNASRHFDFAVTTDFRVIVVYYDEDAGRLKLRYSTNVVTGVNPTANVGWTDSTLVFPEYIGNYVSMTMDAANGIHIAAFDASDADLTYFYIEGYNAVTYSQVTVDAAFSVGLWTQIRVQEQAGTVIPYIAYYNSSETGGRDPIKLAYSTSGISAANVPSGVDANGFTTGAWEYMTVPAITPPQGGDARFKQVNIDFNSSGLPIIGYLGTNLEFGSWLNE